MSRAPYLRPLAVRRTWLPGVVVFGLLALAATVIAGPSGSSAKSVAPAAERVTWTAKRATKVTWRRTSTQDFTGNGVNGWGHHDLVYYLPATSGSMATARW
jgi:hypothetical protein